MSSTRAFGMTAPSESATVPRTVAACAANANSLERRSKHRGHAHGRFCLKYFIFPSEIGIGRTDLLTHASTNLGNLPRDSVPSGCSHLPSFSAFTVTG